MVLKLVDISGMYVTASISSQPKHQCTKSCVCASIIFIVVLQLVDRYLPFATSYRDNRILTVTLWNARSSIVFMVLTS